MRKASWFLIVVAVLLGISVLVWQSGAAAQAQAQKQVAPAPSTKTKTKQAKVLQNPCQDTPAAVNGVVTVEIRPAAPADPTHPVIWPPAVCVWNHPNDNPPKVEQIEWKLVGMPADTDFAVVFSKDTPFKKQVFHSKKPKSDKPTKAPGPKTYKYLVAVDGFESVDPDVIIR